MLLAVRHEDLDEFFEERAKGARITIHQTLRLDPIARTAAFDHVARQGVWCAAKADDAEPVPEMCGDNPDGFAYITQFCGAVGAQFVDVGHCANRLVDHRAFAVNELEVKAHRGEGEQQIGKDDGRIHVKLLCSGDCDLGCEAWGAANLKQ